MAISRVQAMRPALKDVIDLVNQLVDFEPYITNAVDEWLVEHPEATTTVQNGAITWIKLNESLQDKINSIGPTATGTGNSVTANDASAVKLQAATIYGATIDDTSITEAALICTGKNLIDIDNGNFDTLRATIERIGSGTIVVTATASNAWPYAFIEIPISSSAIPSVTLSYGVEGDNPRVVIEGYGPDGRISYMAGNIGPIRYNVPSSATSLRFLFYARNTSVGSVGDTITYSNIQLENGNSPTPYEPYSGSNTPIDLDGHELASNDGIRDELTIASDGSVTLTKRVGEQATYTLLPITMPLQPHPIMIVWAATNITTEISATYVRDINLALDDVRDTALATIAPIEGDTASTNYAIGSYLIYDNKLCIVVTSIASGEPIIIGQNVTVTTVMAELVRLTQ